MTHLHLFLALAAVGLILMSTGFTWREKPWGMALLAAGIVTMLSVIGYGVYLATYQV